MKPRARGKKRSGKPPPAGRAGPRSSPPPALPVQYKVVELSAVDEGSLERTLNAWVGQGWTLESIQFAMRESSKRPAMAFVLFTRPGAAPAAADAGEGRRKLARLAAAGPSGAPIGPRPDALARLRELASDEPPPPRAPWEEPDP